MDRYDLYELCTQSAAQDVALLRAIHGGRPRRLGEDFAGSGALSRAWVTTIRGGTAIAVDHDPEPLARLARFAGMARMTSVCSDVLRVRAKVDVIAALNFSICEWHARARLLAYFRHVRSRLRPDGLFVCDLYGGAGAFTPGRLRQRQRGPHGESIVYEFEQRSADATSGRVVDALHFRVTPRVTAASSKRRSPRALVLRDAFVYDWRLWSLPEVSEALDDAGFHDVRLFPRGDHALDGRGRVHVAPIGAGEPLPRDWCLFVTGRR